MVKDATRVARNATARRRRTAFGEAEAWVAHYGARVTIFRHHDGWLYEASLPGFWPSTAATLVDAVAGLRANVEQRCAAGSPTAPRGRRMDAYRAARDAWEEARHGD